MDLKSKTVVIVKVNNDFGRALVKLLWSKNANVVFSGSDQENNQRMVRELMITGMQSGDRGGSVVFKKYSETSDHQYAEIMAIACQKFENIDIVISLIGIQEPTDVLNNQYELLNESALESNLSYLTTLHRLAIRQFLKQGSSGCIINTCPLIGLSGYIFDPLFFAMNNAILGITKSYASLLEETDIGVYVVQSGIQDLSTVLFDNSHPNHTGAGVITTSFGQLSLLPLQRCLESYLYIIEDKDTNGYSVVVDRHQNVVDAHSESNAFYDKLHQLSKRRKNAFLDNVKQNLLEYHSH